MALEEMWIRPELDCVPSAHKHERLRRASAIISDATEADSWPGVGGPINTAGSWVAILQRIRTVNEARACKSAQE